jgi:hypothetical protein
VTRTVERDSSKIILVEVITPIWKDGILAGWNEPRPLQDFERDIEGYVHLPMESQIRWYSE